MAETEYQRNQRLIRESVERTEIQAEAAAVGASSAAAWAAETNHLQAQQLAVSRAALSSQERHQWAMWTQTKNGRAYIDWEKRANAIIARARARRLQVAEAFSADVAEHISEADRASHASGDWLLKSDKERVARRWGTAGGWLLVLVALFIVVNFILSLFHASAPYQWRTVLVALGIAIALVIVSVAKSDSDWTARNESTRKAAASRRFEVFGFDPLDEPERTPADWFESASDHSENWTSFANRAEETYPTRDELPRLSEPRPRAVMPGDSPRVKALLAEWGATRPTAVHDHS